MSVPFITGELGIFPPLQELIGRPDVSGGGRWSGLVENDSRMGKEFRQSWSSLVSRGVELCSYLDIPLEGPLASALTDAGNGSSDGSTRALVVKGLESFTVQAIKKVIDEQADRNSRPRRFFLNRDKISQAWLSALPGPLTHIPSAEFTQAMAWLFMLPSPACSPFVGSMVCGKPLDMYGEVLMCATLPFDSWRVRHDKVKSEIRAIGVDAGVIVDAEPYGLFSPFIPSAATSEGGHLHHTRERQGLVPDLLVCFPHDHGPHQNNLAEIKILGAGLTWYRGTRKSVDVRADRLAKEYF